MGAAEVAALAQHLQDVAGGADSGEAATIDALVAKLDAVADAHGAAAHPAVG